VNCIAASTPPGAFHEIHDKREYHEMQGLVFEAGSGIPALQSGWLLKINKIHGQPRGNRAVQMLFAPTLESPSLALPS
jgi:hypothetical protein